MLGRTRRRGVVVALLTGAVMFVQPVSPAAADEPANWVDPNYPGSVNDARALEATALSNATATNGAAAPVEGCVSAGTTPYLRPDSESYSGYSVNSRIWLYSNTYCSEIFRLEYFSSRDNDWYAIEYATYNGGAGTYVISELREDCLRGTYSYRVSGNNWHGTATRLTCSDPDEPFRIDS